MINIRLSKNAQVGVHPYRTARVGGVRFDVDCTESEMKAYRRLLESLSKRAGVTPDNHVVFEIQEAGQTLYAWFSDGVIYIGTQLVLGSW